MVNFKCCLNIFVFFWEKNWFFLVWFFFFFFGEKKITFCHVANCGHVLKLQPRVMHTWLTCRGVFGVTHGTMATWITWTRDKLYISQQPDLPRRAQVAIYTWLTVCHVYGPHTCGNLQVANCKFFL
jgi:hypothetical protein